MKIIPCGKRIIISEVIEPEKKSVFIIPDEDKPRKTTFKGVVIAIGNLENLDLEPGQTILFHKHAPEAVEYEGKPCWLINENDVLALITDDDSTKS